MHPKNFVLYGANGYTARIIIPMAIERGYKPILAGRNELTIKELANRYGLKYEICDLQNQQNLNDLALSADLVLHCAGPFSKTAIPMLQACLKSKTHYVDITGEIGVFEALHKYDKEAKDANITVLPGAGFDVVPTDCLAAYLKTKLPSANTLTLAIASKGGGISHGTATTMLQNIDSGGAVRLSGNIVKVPTLHKTRNFDFPFGTLSCATIPWGDVSTAFYSTGIPNIEVYSAMPSYFISTIKTIANSRILTSLAKRFLQKAINSRLDGPPPEQRLKGKSFVWGEVTNKEGKRAAARLSLPEGYTLTALTAMLAVQKILDGNIATGFQTPATAFGHNFIMEIKGALREDMIIKY